MNFWERHSLLIIPNLKLTIFYPTNQPLVKKVLKQSVYYAILPVPELSLVNGMVDRWPRAGEIQNQLFLGVFNVINLLMARFHIITKNKMVIRFCASSQIYSIARFMDLIQYEKDQKDWNNPWSSAKPGFELTKNKSHERVKLWSSALSEL